MIVKINLFFSLNLIQPLYNVVLPAPFANFSHIGGWLAAIVNVPLIKDCITVQRLREADGCRFMRRTIHLALHQQDIQPDKVADKPGEQNGVIVTVAA